MTHIKILIIVFHLLGASLLAKSPIIEISSRFDPKIQPMNSQSQFLFFDCTGDGQNELVIQTNRDFYIYRIDIQKKTLVFQKKTLGIPPGIESGICQYSLGWLSPDYPRSIIVKAQTGIYYFPFNDDGLLEKPKLIYQVKNNIEMYMKFDDYIKPARLNDNSFIQDIEGDGYDEIIMDEGDVIKILKIVDKQPILLTPPQTSTDFTPEFNITKENAYILGSKMKMLAIIPDRINKRSGILLDKTRSENPRYEFFQSINPLSYASTPTQILRLSAAVWDKFKNKNISARWDRTKQQTKESIYHRVMDINGDGWFDLVIVSSNLNFLSPLTKAEIYLSPPSVDASIANPSSTVRMRDHRGFVAFADFNSDGAIDLFNLRSDYNPSSVDDIAEVILGDTVCYSAGVYLFNKNKNAYPDKPDWTLPLKMKVEVFHRHSIAPYDVLSDFNGDGLVDLLIWTDKKEARVHLCGAKGFEKKSYFTIKGEDVSHCRIDRINNGAEDDLVLFSLKQMRINLFILGEK